MQQMVRKELTVGETKEYIRQSIEKKDKRAIFLWGEGGIGKTSLVYQVAKELNIYLIDKKLSQENPVTTVGLFYPDVETQETKRFPRHFLKVAIERDKQGLPTIIFFDELINANPDVISSIWEIVNERLIEGYKFENLYIIAASNIIDENITMINPAFWTRFSHIFVQPDAKEVILYINKTTKCSHVPTFLKLNPNLVFVKGGKFQIRANPRSWEWVARHCCEYDYDENMIRMKVISDLDIEDGSIPDQFLKIREKLDKFNFLPIEEYLKNPKKLPSEKELSAVLFILFSISHYNPKNWLRELKGFVNYLMEHYSNEFVELLFEILKEHLSHKEMLEIFKDYFKEFYTTDN